jgi:hypothetical protein
MRADGAGPRAVVAIEPCCRHDPLFNAKSGFEEKSEELRHVAITDGSAGLVI